MTNRNSMVPSSKAPTENHEELKEVQSTMKMIKNIRKGPRRGTTLGRG